MNERLHGASREGRMWEIHARRSGQIAQGFGSMRRDLACSFAFLSPELHVLVRRAWGAIRFPTV